MDPTAKARRDLVQRYSKDLEALLKRNAPKKEVDALLAKAAKEEKTLSIIKTALESRVKQSEIDAIVKQTRANIKRKGRKH